MLAATRRVLVTLQPPHGIAFQLTAAEAAAAVRRCYDTRWFGLATDYLDLQPPAREFLPFYLCSGNVHGTFTAAVDYERQTSSTHTGIGVNAHNNTYTTTHTETITTAPQQLHSVFSEARTQLYAGYKYNNTHVERVLCDENVPLQLQPICRVDTSDATIHLFEQSTVVMRDVLQRRVRAQAVDLAVAMVRPFHPTASAIRIHFVELHVVPRRVTPTFLPCFIVRARYDGEEYTVYVSGTRGVVSGPYLINPVTAARAAGAAALLMSLVVVPNKVAAVLLGSVWAVALYYAAYMSTRLGAARWRDRQRRQRAALQRAHAARNATGYRPDVASQRVEFEYQHSSYSSDHPYEERRRSGSSSSAAPEEEDEDAAHRRRGAAAHAWRTPRDVHGYYALLGLHGDESVNEIRSAYRRKVLAMHPDVGGTTRQMSALNEAYRVLRDPARRAAYDRL